MKIIQRTCQTHKHTIGNISISHLQLYIYLSLQHNQWQESHLQHANWYQGNIIWFRRAWTTLDSYLSHMNILFHPFLLQIPTNSFSILWSRIWSCFTSLPPSEYSQLIDIDPPTPAYILTFPHSLSIQLMPTLLSPLLFFSLPDPSSAPASYFSGHPPSVIVRFRNCRANCSLQISCITCIPMHVRGMW